MSEFERPYTEELIPFDEEIYSNFLESWDMFQSHQLMFFTALQKMMDGTAADTLADAIACVQMAKQNYVEAIEDLTMTIFDDIDHDEAIEVWSNVIYIATKERLNIVRSLDIQAAFDLTPLSEIRISAHAHAEGRLKALEDGLHDAGKEDTPAPSKSYQIVGIEQLHELLASDEMEWFTTSDESEGNDYGEWVLDQLFEDIDEQVDGLLELCPPERYAG